MPLQNTHVIDMIAQDAATGTVVLGMTEPRPWDGGDLQLFQLQEKVNAYLAFALDGEMNEHFPKFRDQPLRLELICTTDPDPRTAHFVNVVREQIGFQGIEFVVKVNSELAQAAEGGACASGSCGCSSGKAEHEHTHESHEGCCGGHDHGHAHEETGCCGGHNHGHAHEESGCCGGHDHAHAEEESGCCGGNHSHGHGSNGCNH